jgi:hypothetical protein
MRQVAGLKFGWRQAMLVVLVLVGVLWVIGFDRCLYAPVNRSTPVGCFISSLVGTFVGLYLAAAAALLWLVNLMGGR